jgi:hypothetical protein
MRRAVPWQPFAIMEITETHTQTRNAAGEKAAANVTPSSEGEINTVFIYIDLSAPGLSWDYLNSSVPDYLKSETYVHRTQSGNAVLAFRSAQPAHDHLRLASHGRTEVIALMNDSTLWGSRMRERLVGLGFNPQELPALKESDEAFLIKLMTAMARAVGLHVAMKNDTLGVPATKSAKAEAQTKTHIP